jgi:hypothetical protein
MGKLKIVFMDLANSNRRVEEGIIKSSDGQFINLIETLNINILYSSHFPQNPSKRTKYFLYFPKEGFIFSAGNSDIPFLERFFDISKYECNHLFEYLESEYYQINSLLKELKAEYPEKYNKIDNSLGILLRDYKPTNFFSRNRTSFKDYLISRMFGFSKKHEFEAATRQGITEKEEYDKFKASGYGKYENYLRGIEGVFENHNEFYVAKRHNIETYNKYQEFLKNDLKHSKEYRKNESNH